MQRKRRDVEAQIEALRRQLEEEERELMQSMQKVVEIDERAKAERDAMTRSRQQDMVGRSA
jgi:hypothetical protein